MSKRIPKVKFDGPPPQNNVLTAAVPAVAAGGRQLISLPHRHAAVIEAKTSLASVEPGHRLCWRLVPSITGKGAFAANAGESVVSGKVVINLINCGREIVEIRDGDPLVEVWLEEIIPFEWTQK